MKKLKWFMFTSKLAAKIIFETYRIMLTSDGRRFDYDVDRVKADDYKFYVDVKAK